MRTAYTAYRAERERLRGEMIALQEEMDWLVYAAYGLTSESPSLGGFGFLIADWDAPVAPFAPQSEIQNLKLGERPFELVRAGLPIPAHFSRERRALWQARLKAIEDNEHIRRIEQPVYKRRWYRKENDEREFQRAFEWWLEHKAHGGPVTLGQWVEALWQDERVLAAAKVMLGLPDLSGQGPLRQVRESDVLDPQAFAKLKSIVVESTVPDWIPPAMPWERVEKKFKAKVPARAKKIRGKLNVPRERFRLTDEGGYVWAGKTAGD